MPRKVIQIAATEAMGNVHSRRLFALCDDGSVWMYAATSGEKTPKDWARLLDIPQDVDGKPATTTMESRS